MLWGMITSQFRGATLHFDHANITLRPQTSPRLSCAPVCVLDHTIPLFPVKREIPGLEHRPSPGFLPIISAPFNPRPPASPTLWDLYFNTPGPVYELNASEAASKWDGIQYFHVP
jgi:hypothetical protein